MARGRGVQRPLTTFLVALMLTTMSTHSSTLRPDFTGLFQLNTDHSRNGLALVFHLREKPEERFWLYLYSHPSLNLSCSISEKNLMLIDNIIRPHPQLVTNNTVACNEYRVCTLYFSNVSEGYYCAQKLERPTNLYTATVYVTQDPSEVIVPMLISSLEEGIPLSVWLIGAAILVLALNIAGWSYFRKKSTSTAPELPEKTQNDSQLAPLLTLPSRMKLFLVYVKDDESHLDMVVTLVSLFRSLFPWEVIVDYECKERISTLGPSIWVFETLRQANKVLFISSKEAHRLIQTLTTRTKLPNNENQLSQKVFLFAWRIVSANLQMCDKYNKIYIARFRSTSACFLTQSIVRGRHFVIPTHLPQLAYQLTTCGQETEAKMLEKGLENTLKSSPFYTRLITAVLPINNDIIEEENNDDFTWISPGF